MAAKVEKNKPDQVEGKIPVFSVIKNGSVLKNIFIVNKPPDPIISVSNLQSESTASLQFHDYEDVLLVGRHPDCNIMLTHPSISRFHLQIQSKPSSQNLSVVDLSSVHGTWVSGRKLEPGVSVEMKEGDTLRIGVSSRVYRLHWIPISQAYDLENRFLSELDVVLEAEDGEEDAVPEESAVAEMVQNLNCCPIEIEETHSVDSILECISSLFLDDENLELTMKKEIPTAPPMPEGIISFRCDVGSKIPSNNDTCGFSSDFLGSEASYLPAISYVENKLCDSQNQVFSPPSVIVYSVLECDKTVKIDAYPEVEIPHVSVVEVVQGIKTQQFYTPPDTFTLPLPLVAVDAVDSVLECDKTVKIEACPQVEIPPYTVVEAVQGMKMQQFYTPTDTFTSPLPPVVVDSSQNHLSSLLKNIDPASANEKSEPSVVVIPKDSEFGYTRRDNDRITDILNAGALNFNSENMSLSIEEVMPDTKFEQIEVVHEVSMDSLSDEEKQDNHGEEYEPRLQSELIAKSCQEQGNSPDEIVQDIGNKLTGSIRPLPLQGEPVTSSMLQETVLQIINDKENQSLQSSIAVARCSGMKIVERHIKATEKNSTLGNIWSRRGKVASAPQVQIGKSTFKSTATVDTEVKMNKEKDKMYKTISKDLFSVLNGEEDDEIFTPDKENFSPNTLELRSQRSLNSKADNISPIINPDDKTISKDLFSVLNGGEEEEESFTPDKENFSPNTLQLRLLKKKGKLEEIKHSKQQRSRNRKANNVSPNIYPDESMITLKKENRSPKVVLGCKLQRKPLGSHVKENQGLKVTQEYKLQTKPFGSHIKLGEEEASMALKKRVEGVPFQSLMNPGGEGRSETSDLAFTGESVGSSNCGKILNSHINPSHINGQPKKSWLMIVDTASLLNKESRKALQLLQGVRGTRLIIPRLVIRELESMKQHFRIFRRISEASLALEWIEECMVKTKWWIHIQSLMEEERLVAPTPPASPQTQLYEEFWTFSRGIGSWQPLSSIKSLMEVDSPTVEDHILDFALQFRNMQNDGQLVLLSDDVTLKIKCMAKGLLCETVEEFRESLVNPFSERFMWCNSSPRGLTWSCQDDVVLREKYCRLPLRKSSKGFASGLKLILLYNSQYRQ